MSDQRRAKRFELKLPVELVCSGPRKLAVAGETVNVSSGGILFTHAGDSVDVGQPIEYMISLPTGARIGEVRLRCMGKVVRHDDMHPAMAATLERYEFVRTV